MTVTSNLHIGLTAWASGQTVAVGARRSNSSKAYQATTAGTTGATGPTHTSSTASDGAVTWKYLSAIDYTSLSTWAASFPSTLTQPIVGLLWNNGEITHTAAPLASFSGHTTSSTNTITLQPAPGESLADAIAAAPSTPLYYDASKGVAIRRTGNNYAYTFELYDPYVTIKGLQINDGLAGYRNYAMRIAAINVTIDANFIVGGGVEAPITVFYSNGLLIQNNVFDYRGGSRILSLDDSDTTLLNNTFVLTATSNTTVGRVGTNTVTAKNNLAFATSTGVFTAIFERGAGSGTGGSWTYGVSDVATVGTAFTISNSLTGKSASNQFVSTSGDFKLKSGADALDVGTSTGTPAVDFIGTSRPQGSGYDAGAWELAVAAGSIGTLSGSGSLAGVGTALVPAAGTLAGAGSLAGAGAAAAAATGVLGGAGALAGAGASVVAAGGSLAGSGVLAGSGAAAVAAAGVMVGAGDVSGAGASAAQAAGVPAGAGALAGVGSSVAAASGTMGGGAAVVVAGASVARASGTSAGTGAIAAGGAGLAAAGGLLAGSAILLGTTGSGVQAATGAVTGSSVLAAVGRLRAPTRIEAGRSAMVRDGARLAVLREGARAATVQGGA